MTGTYVLAIEVDRPIVVEVGALGEREFAATTYAYVGSAFGPGGFARLDRHRELADAALAVRHWHIDYLLGRPETTLAATARFPDADRECELAGALPGESVPGFGASDCDCPAHLLEIPDFDELLEALEDAGGVVDAG
jgi:Uri superfamily endonuclease